MEHSRNFEQIVKEYTPRIFKMIYNMTRDYETSKDLTQDVFVRAWSNFNSFRGEASIYTWIYRIALNRVFEYRKKASRIKTISIDDIQTPEIKEPEKDLLLKADVELLKRTIRELPPKYYAILILRYFEGNDYATIARILEIPVGTVRSRLHRGISLLTNLMREKI